MNETATVVLICYGFHCNGPNEAHALGLGDGAIINVYSCLCSFFSNDDTDADSQVYETFTRFNQSEGDNGTLLHGKHWNWLGIGLLLRSFVFVILQDS